MRVESRLAKLRVTNQTRRVSLAEFASIANTSSTRRAGLLKHTALQPGDGLWIAPCEGVHTFGMKFAIDVVFLSKHKVVRKIRSNMARRGIALDLLAHSVLELPAGTILATGTAVGDQLEFEQYEIEASSGDARATAAKPDGAVRGPAGPFNTSLLLLTTFLVCACTRRVVTVHDPLPPPVPAVRAVMQHQVLNAVDAGEGDFDLRQLRARVMAAPDDVEARLALGRHYRDRGFPDFEIEHYRLAVSRFPASAPAAMALAKALHAANANQGAKDVIVAFCKRNPDGPAELFAFVGILEDQAGNLESAEPWHQAAILRQPSLDAWHNNLGYNLLLQGRADQAAAEFRRALELNPRSEIARNNLGVALAADPTQAILQWQSISGPATAHSNMAAILIEQKRYAEAREQIQAALEYSPKYPAALENLKLVAELDGKSATAAPGTSTARHRMSLLVRKVLGAN